MLMIRLQRFGRRNQPKFRVVLTDSRKGPKTGAFKEVLGWRDPRQHTVSLERDRILHWISRGAQTSDTVHNLLVKEGVIKGSKIDVAPKVPEKEAHEKGEGEGSEAQEGDVEEKPTDDAKDVNAEVEQKEKEADQDTEGEKQGAEAEEDVKKEE